MTLVHEDSLGRNTKRVWEIIRGDEIIMTYEEALESLIQNQHRIKPMAYLCLITSILLLLSGISLRIKFGSWSRT